MDDRLQTSGCGAAPDMPVTAAPGNDEDNDEDNDESGLKAPGPAALADRLIRLVRKLRKQEINSLFDLAMGPTQLAILEIVGADPGLRMRVVGERLGVDRSAVTRAVRGLERNGFVVRQRSDRDRRTWGLHATRSGRAALHVAADAELCPSARLVAGLGAADRRRLEVYLARMDASLDLPVAERWRRLVLGWPQAACGGAAPPSGFPPSPPGC